MFTKAAKVSGSAFARAPSTAVPKEPIELAALFPLADVVLLKSGVVTDGTFSEDEAFAAAVVAAAVVSPPVVSSPVVASPFSAVVTGPAIT